MRVYRETYATTVDMRGVAFTSWQAGVDQVFIYGSWNTSFLYGSSVADTIVGGSYFDGVSFVDIVDIMSGGLGADSLSGGTGNDLFDYDSNPLSAGYSGSIANETINGGDGDDGIRVANGVTDFSQATIIDVETLFFNIGSGTATATFNGDQVGAAAGWPIYRIQVSALGAACTFRVTGSFADLSNLGFTNWDGNDQVVIAGTNGLDVIRGSSKADLIGEGPNMGADDLVGAGGNDTLQGGLGADRLDGGTDYDFASYQGATVGVTARLDYAVLNTGEQREIPTPASKD